MCASESPRRPARRSASPGQPPSRCEGNCVHGGRAAAPQGRDHWDKDGNASSLEALRSEAGEAMVLQNNYFIEEILPNAILRGLSDKEMAEYRRPFTSLARGDGRYCAWPRQIPIEGEPADVHAIATDYADWAGTGSGQAVPEGRARCDPCQ